MNDMSNLFSSDDSKDVNVLRQRLYQVECDRAFEQIASMERSNFFMLLATTIFLSASLGLWVEWFGHWRVSVLELSKVLAVVLAATAAMISLGLVSQIRLDRSRRLDIKRMLELRRRLHYGSQGVGIG